MFKHSALRVFYQTPGLDKIEGILEKCHNDWDFPWPKSAQQTTRWYSSKTNQSSYQACTGVTCMQLHALYPLAYGNTYEGTEYVIGKDRWPDCS